MFRFLEEDKALIARGCLCYRETEYLLTNLFTQEQEISGPPRYLTTDWELP